jgi:hypothetical protein
MANEDVVAVMTWLFAQKKVDARSCCRILTLLAAGKELDARAFIASAP